MTILHQNLKAGPDGKLHVGDIDVGVPDAEVEVTFSVRQKTMTQEQWSNEMRALLNDLGEVHIEEYPRTPIRDPWENS